MSETGEPVILELATLPREQVGPFLLLGLEKDADQEQIEASWARRLIWARKKKVRIALEDINWAREILNDPDRRVRADVTALNADTIDGTLRQLAKKFGEGEGESRAHAITWQPLDVDTPLAFTPPETPGPDPIEFRGRIPLPHVPEEMPAIPSLLKHWSQGLPDPWKWSFGRLQ